MLGVILWQALDLIVEGEQFSSFRAVHLDGFAFARDLGVVDLALAFGGEICA
jgi:hypothetical protein